MKKTLLFLPLLIFGAILLGQDSTGTGPSGSFPLTWPDVFDLVDMILVWAIGIAAGRWRQVLQALASVLPFLEGFVNQKDKAAVLSIAKAREARLLKRGKPLDLIVEVKDTDPGRPSSGDPKIPALVFVLLLSSIGLFAQGSYDPPFEPALPPGEYPTMARDGFRFYATDHDGLRRELFDGDTIVFNFSEPEIGDSIWMPFPIFGTDTGSKYHEFRKYTDGQFWDVGWVKGDTSTSLGTKFPKYWEGLYFGLQLRDSLDGRFIRFYVKTNESLAIYTDTLRAFDTTRVTIEETVFVYDTTIVEKEVLVFDTVVTQVSETVFDTVLVEEIVVVLDTIITKITETETVIVRDTIEEVVLSVQPADLQYLSDKLDEIPTAGVIADSVVSRLGPGDPAGPTKAEAILAELKRPELDPTALAAKYYKSRTIDLEGFQVSTCDFAAWAAANGEQISCRLSELVIFQVCKDLAANFNQVSSPNP